MAGNLFTLLRNENNKHLRRDRLQNKCKYYEEEVFNRYKETGYANIITFIFLRILMSSECQVANLRMPAGGLKELQRNVTEELKRVKTLFPVYESGTFDAETFSYLSGSILCAMYAVQIQIFYLFTSIVILIIDQHVFTYLC